MILDGLLLFTGAGVAPNTDSPTTGTQAATNQLDLGVTSGIPSSANGGGARDLGTTKMLQLLVQVTTAFSGGTSLQAQLQGAPDSGTGTEGSYTTMWTGPAVVEANLDVGAYLANVNVPRVVPGQVLPRFLKLNFITVGTHVAGAVIGGIVLDRFDQPFGVDNALSGYPAGLNVAN